MHEHETPTRSGRRAGLGLAAAIVPLSPLPAHADDPPLKILPPTAASPQKFGEAVDIEDGVILIGAPGSEKTSPPGAAYLYDAKTGELIHELVRDPFAFRDSFGNAVALHNGIALVGAYLAPNEGDTPNGIVFLFDVSTGEQIATLRPAEGSNEGLFGYTASLTNGVAVVGDFTNSDLGPVTGAAFLYETTSGQRLAPLYADDAAMSDAFGTSVDINPDFCLVGSFSDDNGDLSGSVYVFDTKTAQQLRKLTPHDGATRDFFGGAVSLAANNLAFIGAQGDDDEGSVYLFDVSTGDEITKLLPEDDEYTNFGWSIRARDNLAVVGAGSAAYLFDAQTRQQIDMFAPHDLDQGYAGFFAQDVALDADHVVVGAPRDNEVATFAGAVYVYPVPPTPCSSADIAEPFSTLNLDDAIAFLTAFSGAEPPADLAAPYGSHDFSDVIAFLAAFAAGCP